MSNSLYGMIDLMIAGCGLYVIVQYLMMKTSKKIRQNMLLPKNIDLRKCKDQEGYINYIGRSQLAFGVTAVINGIVGMLQDIQLIVSPGLSLLVMVLFIAAAGWYICIYKKAMSKFWKI